MDKSTHGSEPVSQLDEFETWKVNEFIHRFKNVIDRNAIAIEVLREKLEEVEVAHIGEYESITGRKLDITYLRKSIELLTKK